MITEVEFDNMCLDDKGEIVFTFGRYIATRPYYNFNVNLYKLYNYLVEVWYFCPDNQIERIEVLKSNKTYRLFAEGVNIENIN